jgi:hypothetical protein
MAVNLPDLVRNSVATIEDGSPVRGSDDRRRRDRLPLQLPVKFYTGDADAPIHGTTRDMSSEGFFCLSRATFTPGESVTCSIEYPAFAPDVPESRLVITCRVRIIRTVPDATQGIHGIACRIQDFECRYLK